jgi:D-alanyl-D-alanine carboxypeptidase
MHKKRNLAARLCTVLLSFLCIILSALPALAATPTPPAITDGRAVILYDKTHGNFVAEQNAKERVNTSTSAKIMTGLIACERLSARLDDAVTVTEEMLTGASGYSMKLKVGERISVRDLLYGAICGSYNDAAYVLASVIGGNSDGFVSIMNEYAVTLVSEDCGNVLPLVYLVKRSVKVAQINAVTLRNTVVR